MRTKAKDQHYIANTYVRHELAAEEGKGAEILGEDGKQYIDLGSGIGVNLFGTADPLWTKAVTDQLHKIQHISNYYYTQPQTDLAQMLCQKTGLEKVFFSNSGAEANECAIKCARKYAFDRYGQGRSVIITLEQSFHGRTMATLSATGQESMHDAFFPFLPDFVHVPPNDLSAMEAALQGNVCAVMLELVQGEGGVVVLDQEYVTAVTQLCAEKDILLIIDEVQTGNGRTGSLYAFMQYGILPDLVTTAKGLGGGLPIGATLMGEKVKDVFSAGSHGSTFGGNPVCAAGAVNVLSRLDEVFLAEVVRKGELLRATLHGAPGIHGISGLGMMIGIHTTKDPRDVAAQCLNKGVLVLTAKEKVRLLPPLTITDAELLRALDILKGVLAS